MKYEKHLDIAAGEAEKFAKDSAAVGILADKAHAKVRKAEKSLKGLKRDLDTLVRLSRAWATGKYKDISWSSIVVVIGAVLYFVNPFDALPDFMPLIGFTDDLSVVGFALIRVRQELDKFHEWEKEITVA